MKPPLSAFQLRLATRCFCLLPFKELRKSSEKMPLGASLIRTHLKNCLDTSLIEPGISTLLKTTTTINKSVFSNNYIVICPTPQDPLSSKLLLHRLEVQLFLYLQVSVQVHIVSIFNQGLYLFSSQANKGRTHFLQKRQEAQIIELYSV